MRWIIGIFMSLMALLSHQTAPAPVATPIPAIIEAKGAVAVGESKRKAELHIGVAETNGVEGTNQAATSSLPSTTSFINPNASFMETHVPKNTPEPTPAEEPKVEEVKPSITPEVCEGGYTLNGYGCMPSYNY